jgi:hypothetical protein
LHQNKVIRQQIPNNFQSKYQQKFTGNNYTDRRAENIGTIKSFCHAQPLDIKQFKYEGS